MLTLNDAIAIQNLTRPIKCVPGLLQTLPPKDGLVVAALLMGKTTNSFIFWDPSWGGRGGWFTVDNKAVSEKSIITWEPRRVGANDFETVARLNYDIKQERKKNKA